MYMQIHQAGTLVLVGRIEIDVCEREVSESWRHCAVI